LLDALPAAPPAVPAAAGPGRSLRGDVAHAYRRLRKRARRAASLAAGPERDAALHEMRKAAKRARYAADALTPSGGKPAKRFAAQMKQIQSVLGDHHDTVVARAVIRDLGVHAHLAGDNAFTYGVLYQLDAGRADGLSDEAAQVWREAHRKKYRRWLS
jgi:CHAD domain-containing protein